MLERFHSDLTQTRRAWYAMIDVAVVSAVDLPVREMATTKEVVSGIDRRETTIGVKNWLREMVSSFALGETARLYFRSTLWLG